MRQPLRVMIVTRSLMMGGAQRHIVKLCQELAGREISISVCLLISDEPRDLVDELPPETKLYISPYRRHDIRTVFWLAKMVRAEKSQLVHSFLWHADFYASFLKLLIPGLTVIGSERGDRSDAHFYRPAYNWTDRLFVFRIVDGFCANSYFGKRLLIAKGCKPEKISVIHNGVNLDVIDSHPALDVREEMRWASSSTVFCIVSRLVDYKGVDGFIRAIQSCDDRMRFLVIGDGPQKDFLHRLVKELSLQDRVALIGQRNPSVPFIKGSDICVLPTPINTEHCSNSILEYMACGKPVVAMNIAGNPELITHGVNGVLIDPGCMEDLPGLLDRLAVDKDLTTQMGIASRRRVEEQFKMQDVANRFRALWRSFLSYERLLEDT